MSEAAGGEAQAAPSMSTTYNGTVPCQGCGTNLGPAQVLHSGKDRHCHQCRKKKHTKHVKGRMST